MRPCLLRPNKPDAMKPRMIGPNSGGTSPVPALRAPTGITAANVASLTRYQIHIDGTVDASAIYLHDVAVKGSNRDVFFVTTSYGKTIAVDASTGAIVW